MKKSVRELLAEFSSYELAEWRAFSTFFPIGERREDMRMAILCSVIANCHRDPKKSALKPEDFMPFLDDDELSQESIVQKVAESLGAP